MRLISDRWAASVYLMLVAAVTAWASIPAFQAPSGLPAGPFPLLLTAPLSLVLLLRKWDEEIQGVEFENEFSWFYGCVVVGAAVNASILEGLWRAVRHVKFTSLPHEIDAGKRGTDQGRPWVR